MSTTLKNLKIWDNVRYTLKDACAELEKIKGIKADTMESMVQALIDAGPTSPVNAKRRKNTGATTLPPKQKLTCECIGYLC